MEKYQKLPYNFFFVPTLLFFKLTQVNKKATCPHRMSDVRFFSGLIRLLSIDGLMKSEAIVLVSVLPLKFSR